MQVNMSGSILLLTFGAIMFLAVEATSGVTCPDIDPISNADIHTSSQSPYRVGAVANFTCDAGFKGVGQSSITCLRNGRWSGPVPYCTAFKCKRDLSKISKDRKCRKRCKRDSQCKGAFKRCVCDDWCGKSCFNPDAVCPNLTPPANGYILANGLSYGHTLTYGCHSGYTLTGPSTRRCRSDRTWSQYPPLCVPFGTCGQPGDITTSQVAGKVTEGTNAKQGAWPWQALLMYNLDYTVDQIYNTGSGFGGGSIINDEWILSAAHVFTQFPQAKIRNNWKDRFLIVVGMTTYPNRGHAIPEHIHIFEPNSLYQHPSFNKLNFDYDVALIRIGKRMKRSKNNKFVIDESFPAKFIFSRFIRPVCLPCMKKGPLSSIDIWKNFDREKCNPRGKSIFSVIAAAGSMVMVTGFGMKTDHGDHFQYLPNHLQEGMLKIVDALKCAASVKDIQRHAANARFTNRMFCASGANETARVDSCQGDSGGPIVKSVHLNDRTNYWMQIGIVSWGWKCGGKHPGFYTSVSSIMSWIWKILDDTRIGTWNKWGTWSYCSRKCGGGTRIRYRKCMTKNCQGPRSNSGVCNIARCPPAIQCPSVTPPKDGAMAKSPKSLFYPVGSTITFSCNRGKFLSAGPSTIVCKPSGKWDNPNKPICKDEWGSWSTWTDCSATCGGVKTKVRKCLRKKDVITTFLGCHGSSMATAKCGKENCPEEKKCGQGNNLCLFGTINVDTNRISSQVSQLASRFGFGKRR